jgi:predicted DNA-binding transcriptional regulator AlpA
MPGILVQEDGVATRQKVSKKLARWPHLSARLAPPAWGGLGTAGAPGGTETAPQRQTRSHASSEHGLDPVVSMQLASQLGASVQTLYDLRSQGRGPRGFRVGRELRFRVSEIDSWLAQMEADDTARHPQGVR